MSTRALLPGHQIESFVALVEADPNGNDRVEIEDAIEYTSTQRGMPTAKSSGPMAEPWTALSHRGHVIYDSACMKTIDEHLAAARERLDRVAPENLEEEVAEGALLVDIRPESDRAAEGEMPGAMVIDRIVLEWRLAPSSDARIVDLEPGQRVILFCNESYQSSLAAAALLDLGVDGATDLIGGYRAWKAAVTESR